VIEPLVAVGTLSGRPRRVAGGFTLFEVLLALVLLALISLALTGMVQIAGRMTDAAHGVAARTRSMRLVSELVYRELSDFVPLTTLEGGKRIAHFEGEQHRLVFIASRPGRFRKGGLYEVTLEDGGSSGSDGVRMRWRLMHPDLLEVTPGGVAYRQDAKSDERRLVPRGQVTFTYFGAAGRDAEPEWHEGWNDDWGMPRLVAVRISEPEEVWPEIIAAPAVDRSRFQALRQGDALPLPAAADSEPGGAGEAGAVATPSPGTGPGDGQPSAGSGTALIRHSN